jgi:hypothetical protein
MAEDPQPLGDLKANVERGLEQTRGVLNTYFNFIQRAIFILSLGWNRAG